MNKYILENFGRDTFRDMRHWKIIVRPSTQIGREPFFDSSNNGTGGVTGIGEVRLYLFDNADTTMFIRINSITMSHELAHAALIQRGRIDRVKLRHDDYSGNKKGKALAYSTAEVHDRHIEKQIYLMKVIRWTRFWKSYTIDVLDFKDHKR